jgi:acyl-CoA thioester hydrolase
VHDETARRSLARLPTTANARGVKIAGVEGFAFVFREEVRFSDLDARQHVNNAVFSSFIEDARLAWYQATAADEPAPMAHAVDMILARTEIDFRAEIKHGERVEVGVRPGRVGTKSLTLEYEVRADGRLAAEARSVLVGFDYERGASAPIPDRWLRRVQRAASA